MNEQETYSRQLASAARGRAIHATIALKGMSQEEIDLGIAKLSKIALKKNWNKRPEIFRQICPICENLVKHDRQPVIYGVHNDCLLKIIREEQNETRDR